MVPWLLDDLGVNGFPLVVLTILFMLWKLSFLISFIQTDRHDGAASIFFECFLVFRCFIITKYVRQCSRSSASSLVRYHLQTPTLHNSHILEDTIGDLHLQLSDARRTYSPPRDHVGAQTFPAHFVILSNTTLGKEPSLNLPSLTNLGSKVSARPGLHNPPASAAIP
jgi:hypothetical protein